MAEWHGGVAKFLSGGIIWVEVWFSLCMLSSFLTEQLLVPLPPNASAVRWCEVACFHVGLANGYKASKDLFCSCS